MNPEIEDLKTIMRTKSGRRFINRQMEVCRIHETNATFGPESAWNEGFRNYGLRLLALVKENFFDEYVLMLREAHDDKEVRTQNGGRKQQRGADD